MSKKDKVWIKSMEFFSQYWGCHQMPERSFFFRGYQLPVCARCSGMILGYIFSIFIAPFMDCNLVVYLLLCFPMAIDGLLQYKTSYVSTNFKRLVSGFLYGYGFLGFFIHLARTVLI